MEHYSLQMNLIPYKDKTRQIEGVQVNARARVRRCPFTTGRCDGGEIYADGTVGCGFAPDAGGECEWMAELPDGTSPRDFYNAALMDAMAGSAE